MSLSEAAVLLRIFIGEDDKHDGRPLYQSIVEAARVDGIAGATVLRGPLGYGRSSRIHTTKILRLSEGLPLVIEIIDDNAKIEAFLQVIEPMMGSGLVTLEDVKVIRYGDGSASDG